MKKTGKVLSLAMASACVFSMAACNNNKIDNEVPDETNLYVTILSRGYGTAWLEDALVPAF
jgi:uncharacterized lipoprotein YehR (DUF1307 family)